MFTDGDIHERHSRVLAELADVGMVMVRRLSDAMLATDDMQTQAHLGLAFHRVSRAIRQTMALEFRLMQEARRDDRAVPARPTPSPEPPQATPPRPAALRTGWSEYESDDSDEALDVLDDLLGAETLDVGAVHAAVEASMDRIHRDLAADPVLVKAGVLDARAPARAGPATPTPRNRRSELMGATTFGRPALVAFQPTAQPRGQPIWRSTA